MARKIIFLVLTICAAFIATAAKSKDNLEITANKKDGLKFTAPDESFEVKLGLILQPRAEIKSAAEKADFTQASAQMRRLRLKFSGFAFDPSLQYYIQLGFSPDDMESTRSENDNENPLMDAWLDWNFASGTSIRFGQFKPPGGLSRQMSFSALTFLERSIAESMFTLYRDIGFMAINKHKFGDFYLREYFSLTQGEGRNRSTESGGYCWTGRAEATPFGDFENGGSAMEMDFACEKTPKLLVGGSYSFNDDARRTRAMRGKDLQGKADFGTLSADVLFKYAGFTFFSEFYQRRAWNKKADVDAEDFSVDTGEGFSGQISYTISDSWNAAFRAAKVQTDKGAKTSDYSIAVSKYFNKNKLKLQSDLSYISDITANDKKSKTLRLRFNILAEI